LKGENNQGDVEMEDDISIEIAGDEEKGNQDRRTQLPALPTGFISS
jgi:hypothetical protein